MPMHMSAVKAKLKEIEGFEKDVTTRWQASRINQCYHVVPLQALIMLDDSQSWELEKRR